MNIERAENHDCNKEDFLKKMQVDIREMKEALLGSFDSNGKGLISRIYDVEKRIKSLEDVKKKVDNLFWKALGSAVTGGGIVVVVWKVISFILSKA